MIFTDHYVDQVRESDLVKNLKKGLIEMDNSEFTHHVGCEVSGINYGALRRVNARSRSPLAFGSAVHVGLEEFFRGNPKYLDMAQEEAVRTELDSMGDGRRNSDRLDTILRAYALDYQMKPSMQFDLLSIDGTPQVEQSFSVPLGRIPEVHTENFGTISPHIIWTGKIDLLTMFDDMIAPVDHKTTSVMGAKFVDDKVRSSQMLGYTHAARYMSEQLFGGKKVFGVRINALASRSQGFEFALFDIPMHEWKVQEWLQETLNYLAEWVLRLDRFLTTGVASPIREHCVTKYGKCPYFDVCDALPKMRDRVLFDDEYYYVSDWSPLNV